MKNECTGDKKLLPLYILKILQEYSEDSNPLTQQTIIDYLNKDYNVIVERKAVSNNIDRLIDFGYDIGNIHGKGYYLVAREFEDSELRLLIDSVRFSKFLKKSQSDEIVDKLLKMGTPKFRKSMKAVKFLTPDFNVKDSNLFIHIEDFADAILKKKKVAFQYMEYNVNKELSPVWEEKIIVSPKELVAANGYYYLIGLIDGNEGYTNFRLDKIKDVSALDDNVDLNIKFSLKEYLSTHPLMYCGEPTSATMKVDVKIVGDIIDFFGKNFTVSKDNGESIEIVVRASEWDIIDFALRNHYFVELLTPDFLRKKLMRSAENLTNKYN